ncbi:hypothetical protein [Streptomyces sp. HB132]|uniref:hypothetical protein n=1 Tax=Streptomyces sp. HB132 TaxID=767388 RepID=UPI00195F3BDB|nr:hypothetical protein [Streptomyces sp. HB132]MBM7442453.1 hypothetical protein [Streptomyces sp. HB132]
MTKFFVTVCLPPTAPRKLPRAIAAAMAPYDANLTEGWNPVGHWDRWAIHSSPGNAYLVMPQHDGDRRLVTASTVPRRKAALDALGPLECHGGPRGLLDFDRMRERAASTHDALLAAWTELTAAHPPARPLSDFAARHDAEPGRYSLADARADHLAQPLVQDVARRAVAGDPHFDTSFLTGDPVAYFAQEHEEARLWAVRCAVPGFALVRLDGSWADADTDGHWERANRYLDGLDPETVVLDLLCHS